MVGILLDSSPLPAISNLNLSSDTTAAQYLAQTIDQLDFRFRVAGEFKEENKFVKLIFWSHEFIFAGTQFSQRASELFSFPSAAVFITRTRNFEKTIAYITERQSGFFPFWNSKLTQKAKSSYLMLEKIAM